MSSGAEHAAHGSVKEYIVGLVLSILLTVIPFGLVMADVLSNPLTYGIIALCAVGQLLVQAIFFLHMNGSAEQIWNTVSGAFVVLIVFVIVLGSIWVMNHLNHNMLLGH